MCFFMVEHSGLSSLLQLSLCLLSERGWVYTKVVTQSELWRAVKKLYVPPPNFFYCFTKRKFCFLVVVRCDITYACLSPLYYHKLWQVFGTRASESSTSRMWLTILFSFSHLLSNLLLQLFSSGTCQSPQSFFPVPLFLPNQSSSSSGVWISPWWGASKHNSYTLLQSQTNRLGNHTHQPSQAPITQKGCPAQFQDITRCLWTISLVWV